MGKETQIRYDDYPAIFKPIKWWEDRKAEDMPGYLKINDKVIKVDSWEYDTEDELYFNSADDNKGYMPWSHLPATETEYATYINSKR